MEPTLVVGGVIDLLLKYGTKVPVILDTVKSLIARFKVDAPDDPLASFDTSQVIQVLRERAKANAGRNRARIAELEAAIDTAVVDT